MHYHAEVLIPSEGEVEALVRAALAPFKERYDENKELSGWWDWWQIGGRWTGAKSGYDPSKDSANFERCTLCGGSGKRTDAVGLEARSRNPGYGCNGCDGKGWKVKWPTKWALYPGDVCPAAAVPETLEAYRVVLGAETIARTLYKPNAPAGQHFVPNPEWDGNVARLLAARGIATGRLVTIDYHC